LTEGSIPGSIVKLSWPVVLANILQTAYNLTDTFWVGRLGAEAVAAVSFSFPILFLLISMGVGFSAAGTILVAQYRGKGDFDRVNFVSAQTLLVITIAAGIISVLGYCISEPVIKFTGAAPGVIPMAVSYLKISFTGLIFLFAFFVFQSLLRGVGVVKIPMYIVFGTVILNFAADPLFIMGWGPVPAFGVAGAALATILTQAIAAFAVLLLFLGGRFGIKLKIRNFRPDFKIIKKMFFLGLPVSVEHSTRSLSFAIMIFLVASFGTAVVAAYGIVTRIMSFVIIPAVGFGMATTALVGQNMGAGKILRAEKISLSGSGFTFLAMTFSGILFFVFSKQIVSIFIPQNPQVIETGALFMRTVALSFGFIGLQIVLGGAFRGSGCTFTAMALTLFNFIFLRVLLAYVLSNFTPLAERGIWWAFTLSNLLGGTAAAMLFLTGGWKKKKITEKFNEPEKIV